MAKTLAMIEADEFALSALLYEVGGDVTEAEAEAAVDEWFAELAEERDRKLDGYGRHIHELEARGKAKREEASRLLERARIEEERAKWMKLRLLSYLQHRGLKALDTPLHRFSVTANGGAAPVRWLIPAAELPEGWRDTVVTYRPRTEAVRTALQAGDESAAALAVLEDRGVHLRIR